MPIISAAMLSVIATVLVQLFKPLLPEKEDGAGPRKWLPLLIVVLLTAIGAGAGYYIGDDVVIWGLAGFLAGASSVGIYGTGKALSPQNFTSKGWKLK